MYQIQNSPSTKVGEKTPTPPIMTPVYYSQFKSAMVEELNQAETVIIKLVQADALQEELNILNAL